jgi:hypothetical protein
VFVDRRPAHEPLVEIEVVDRGEQLPCRGHDLRADPVAGEENDSFRHGAGS